MNESGPHLGRAIVFSTIAALAGCNQGTLSQTPEQCMESGIGYSGYIMQVHDVQVGNDSGGNVVVLDGAIGNEWGKSDPVNVTCVVSQDGEAMDAIPPEDGQVVYYANGSFEDGSIGEITFNCYTVEPDSETCETHFLMVTDDGNAGETLVVSQDENSELGYSVE